MWFVSKTILCFTQIVFLSLNVLSLLFWTTGGYDNEASDFIRVLAAKTSEKNGQPHPIVSSSMRTMLSFEILNAALLCVRGSRTVFETPNFDEYGLDFKLNSYEANIKTNYETRRPKGVVEE